MPTTKVNKKKTAKDRQTNILHVEWSKSNSLLQYPYRIKQTRDGNKETRQQEVGKEKLKFEIGA